MGRRKISRKNKVLKPDRPLHNVWPEEVIEELIAFLDYAIAEGFQKAQINESAAQHLSLWSHNGRYSPDQIKRKLHMLRRGFGPEDDISGDLDMIYIEGSKNLTWFNEGQKEKIAKRTSEIKNEKELEDTYSPRKLRSGSKQITVSPDPSSRVRSDSRSTINVSRGNRGPLRATIHPLRKRLIAGDLEEYETSGSISDSQGWSFKAENTPSFDTPVRRTVVTVEIPPASTAPTVPNSTYTSEGTLSPGPDASDYSDTEDRVFDNRKFAAPSAKIRSMTERIECLEKDLYALRRNSALDVDFWKARCHAVELECGEFKRCQNSLAVKLGELLTTGGKVTIDEFVHLQSTVDRLQSMLASRTEVARLLRPGPHSLDNETALWVAKRMEEAHRDLEKIFVTRDADIDWALVLPHSGNLITPLMHRVFPTGTRSEPEIASALKVLRSQGITQKQFLQALSAAALVEWVFQASTATLTLDRYHGFCAPGTTSAYFKALAHVASRDPDFASNIDLDIHRKIIGEAAFKHFLEVKATDLGLRLQEAFEPLWAKQDIADSASETSDVEPSLGEQLAGVFTKTMEVQCRLRVSGRRFRYTWYSSGQTIDPDHTTIYGQKHRDAEGQSRVSLTLMPGIDEILDGTSGVGTSGFVDGCSGLEPAVCLVPAVVLSGNVP